MPDEFQFWYDERAVGEVRRALDTAGKAAPVILARATRRGVDKLFTEAKRELAPLLDVPPSAITGKKWKRPYLWKRQPRKSDRNPMAYVRGARVGVPIARLNPREVSRGGKRQGLKVSRGRARTFPHSWLQTFKSGHVAVMSREGAGPYPILEERTEPVSTVLQSRGAALVEMASQVMESYILGRSGEFALGTARSLGVPVGR